MLLRLAPLIIALTLLSCSNNKEIIYNPDSNKDPYLLYKEGLEAFDENNFFYAHKYFKNLTGLVTFQTRPNLSQRFPRSNFIII